MQINKKRVGLEWFFFKKVKWLDCRANFTKVSPIGVTRDGSDSRNRKYFSQKDVELNRTRDLAQKRKMIRQNSKYNLFGKPGLVVWEQTRDSVNSWLWVQIPPLDQIFLKKCVPLFQRNQKEAMWPISINTMYTAKRVVPLYHLFTDLGCKTWDVTCVTEQ